MVLEVKSLGGKKKHATLKNDGQGGPNSPLSVE